MAILSFSSGKSSINVLGDMLSTNRIRAQQLNKVSTSKRINKAADSVAESAVGIKLQNEVEALKSILTSTASAKSVLDIAEDGLNQISNIITRMTSLTMQSTNSLNTDDDKTKLDTEFQELKQEITRTAESINFNTNKILMGDGNPVYIGKTLRDRGFEKVTLKKNANLDGTYKVSVASGEMKVATFNHGVQYTEKISGLTKPAAGTTKDINIDNLGVVITLNSQYDPSAPVPASDIGADKLAGEVINVTGDIDSEGSFKLSLVGNKKAYIETTIGTVKYRSEEYDFFNKKPLTMVDLITLEAQDGSNKSVAFSPNNVWKNITANPDGSVTIPTNNEYLASLGMVFSPNKVSKVEFQVGTGWGDYNILKTDIERLSAKNLGIGDSVNIKDSNFLSDISEVLKKANSTVQNIRAKVAGIQNRLDFSVSNIQTTILNSESAISSIFDLNISNELVDLSHIEMLQTGESESLTKDIRSRQNLLKLF